MDSDAQLQSQPSTSNCNKHKLPTTLLLGCGAVNHASVPRKLRSALAVKKPGRVITTSPPLSISKNPRHLSNRVAALKKEGGKNSKRKRGRITKDEEEVAETLYALANMYSGSDKANQLGLNDEPADMKSTVVIEAGRSPNAVGDTGLLIPREESRKISSKVSTCKENLLDSKSHFVKLKSSCGVKNTEMSSSKRSSYPAGGSCVKSVSFLPPRLPAWLNSTNVTPQTTIMGNCNNTEKCVRAVVQSKKTWKRSSAHVYIGRLIKVLQISERKEGSPEKPAQLTTPGGDHQLTTINDILRHKRLTQDRQLASETSASCSAKEHYDFLSMGTKVGDMDTNGDVNRAGHSNEALKQFHMQSQNHSGMLFSLPHNVYTSTLHRHNSALAAQQAQVPQYLNSSTVTGSFMVAQMRRQLDLQCWKAENARPPSGVNNGPVLFPHLLGFSNYQQLSHPQPMSVSSYVPFQNVKMNQHQFPLGFDRNGPGFFS